MPPLTLEQRNNLHHGDRLRCISVSDIGTGQNHTHGDNVVINEIYTFRDFSPIGTNIDIDNPDGRRNSWFHQYERFEPVDIISDIPEVIDRPFQFGDIVRVVHLDRIPAHESENWADENHADLRLDTDYAIDELSNPDQYEIGGDVPCRWITLRGWDHHPSRFKFIKISEGTKSMPQVIATCDIGETEKSIFQTIADKKKCDVYIYNMKGVYYNHPSEKSSGLHFYFNCLSADYYGMSSNSPATPLSLQKDQYIYLKSLHGNTKTSIPVLNDGLLRRYDNAYYFAGDFISSVEPPIEDYNRIMYLVWIAHYYFGATLIPVKESLDSLIYGRLNEVFIVSENNRKSSIDAYINDIRDLENRLLCKHKELMVLAHTSYNAEDIDDCADMIDNINKVPNILNTSLNINNGNLEIVVVTKPLIVHLPHGDIPVGSITIKIDWRDTPFLSIVSEYKSHHFHPHYGDGPCWGGFDGMIHQLLAKNSFDILVDIIMKWHGAYDGSGVFSPWNRRLAQKEIGIIIEEGYYMSGEEPNE